jgi:hypothetical protein
MRALNLYEFHNHTGTINLTLRMHHRIIMTILFITIPYSCMVLTVHVVKGRQYSQHIRWPQSRAEMEFETDSRP